MNTIPKFVYLVKKNNLKHNNLNEKICIMTNKIRTNSEMYILTKDVLHKAYKKT